MGRRNLNVHRLGLQLMVFRILHSIYTHRNSKNDLSTIIFGVHIHANVHITCILSARESMVRDTLVEDAW